jgi:hypothetical protein
MFTQNGKNSQSCHAIWNLHCKHSDIRYYASMIICITHLKCESFISMSLFWWYTIPHTGMVFLKPKKQKLKMFNLITLVMKNNISINLKVILTYYAFQHYSPCNNIVFTSFLLRWIIQRIKYIGITWIGPNQKCLSEYHFWYNIMLVWYMGKFMPTKIIYKLLLFIKIYRYTIKLIINASASKLISRMF